MPGSPALPTDSAIAGLPIIICKGEEIETCLRRVFEARFEFWRRTPVFRQGKFVPMGTSAISPLYKALTNGLRRLVEFLGLRSFYCQVLSFLIKSKPCSGASATYWR